MVRRGKYINSESIARKDVMRMRRSLRSVGKLMVVCSLLAMVVLGISMPAAAMPGYDMNKVSDMTGFDPMDFENPTGDTFKIGMMYIFSGPGAGNGRLYWCQSTWLAYDINKRGGLAVDGKKKLIELIKADTQGKPAPAKKMAERMCLEEKVHLMVGTNGSHISLVLQSVAEKYKTPYVVMCANSANLLDGKNFNRYSFRTCLNSIMFGNAMAYYYSKRPEKKFYILCQDYLFGHEMADAFKDGLKKYKPEAVVVDEVYHPLFMKDFAPYVTKIKGSDAEVIYTGDWKPDSENLYMTLKSLQVTLPVANLYADNPENFKALGAAGKGMVNVNDYLITCDTPENKAFVAAWYKEWKHWKSPYNTIEYRYPITVLGSCTDQLYWILDVFERAGTTNPEKFIAKFEGDEYKGLTGVMKMRACDHQAIKPMYATEFEYPSKTVEIEEDAASYGKAVTIPAEFCTPPVPADLARCNK